MNLDLLTSPLSLEYTFPIFTFSGILELQNQLYATIEKLDGHFLMGNPNETIQKAVQERINDVYNLEIERGDWNQFLTAQFKTFCMFEGKNIINYEKALLEFKLHKNHITQEVITADTLSSPIYLEKRFPLLNENGIEYLQLQLCFIEGDIYQQSQYIDENGEWQERNAEYNEMQVIKSFNIFLDNISRQELPQQFLKFRGAVASTVSYTHKFNDNLNVSCATKAGGLGISSKMGYSW